MSYQTSRRQPIAMFQDGGLRRATNPHGCGGSQNSKLGYVLPGVLPQILGGATHSLPKVRFCLTTLYRGHLPPNFRGVQISHPLFLNFGHGGIALSGLKGFPYYLWYYYDGGLYLSECVLKDNIKMRACMWMRFIWYY